MKKEIRKVIVGLTMFGIALCSGCDNPQPKNTEDSQSKEQAMDSLETRIDKHGAEIMASSDKAEARQWMQQPKHVFFKSNPKEVAKFVEEFYQAGAEQVLVVDIEEHEGIQFGESLLVVLPKDPNARKKLFEIGARADETFQNDPVTDKGQKYLYYSLD
jgi:hypothetical protein